MPGPGPLGGPRRAARAGQRARAAAPGANGGGAPAAKRQVDVLVLGGGPVGSEVALIASMLGKSVAVAEPRGCLLAAPTGWVSKALRQCGRDLGAADGAVPVPWAEAERYLAKTAGRALNLTANKFRDAAAFAGCDGEFREPEVLAGPARFLSPSSALVGDSESDAGGVEVEYRNAFICVGSTSLRLPFLPWAEGEAVSWLYDGDTIKDIGRVPSHLVIQGGGTISTEYAFIFRSLGSEVTLCMREENLMEGCEMDRSIQEALLERMLRLGIRVFAADGDFGDVNPPAEKGGTGTVTLRGSGTVLKCDAMMSATGRVGMCDGLDLEAAGCLAPVRGCVPVDPQSMMCIGGSSSRNGGPASGIYAAGDCEEGSVVTPQGLLSTGLAEAYIAASAAFPDEMEAEVGLLNEFDAHCPVAVWVEPTVAYVGRSAEAAERDFGAAGAGSVAVFFKETIKGCVERKKAFEPDEFLKLVYRVPSGRIVGVHIYGRDASEMVHHASELVNGRKTVYEQLRTVPPAVTVQECVKQACTRAAIDIKARTCGEGGAFHTNPERNEARQALLARRRAPATD